MFSEQQRTSKELQDIYKAAISAGIIGWAYGGIPAFIHAKQRYIEQSQAEVYRNQLDAMVRTNSIWGHANFSCSLYT